MKYSIFKRQYATYIVSKEKYKQGIDETIASIQFEGYEVLEKVVKSSGNSGRVYLPTSWIGAKVKIVRVTPKLSDLGDDK